MKKSQVAFEFLTTYGWAFLVVLVMIGALAYFGVLDPSNFLPEKCIFGAGIGCAEFGSSAHWDDPLDPGGEGNGWIKAKLVNGFGYTIVINNVSTMTSGDSDACEGAIQTCRSANMWCGLATGGNAWLTEEEKEFTLNCTTLRKGSKPRVQIEIIYQKADGTYNKVVKGEIQVKP